MKILFNSFLVLFLLGCNIVDSTAQNDNPPKVQNLNPADFHTKINNTPGTLLDVRTDREIKNGYINGAIFNDFLEDDFKEKVLKLPKNQAIFVYCWVGGRSEEAADFLIKNGYTQVYNLNGGIKAWNAKGLPITK